MKEMSSPITIASGHPRLGLRASRPISQWSRLERSLAFARGSLLASSEIREPGVPRRFEQARRTYAFFHLVSKMPSDQCLQPCPSENRTGFAKVGLVDGSGFGRSGQRGRKVSPPTPPLPTFSLAARRARKATPGLRIIDNARSSFKEVGGIGAA